MWSYFGYCFCRCISKSFFYSNQKATKEPAQVTFLFFSFSFFVKGQRSCVFTEWPHVVKDISKSLGVVSNAFLLSQIIYQSGTKRPL